MNFRIHESLDVLRVSAIHIAASELTTAAVTLLGLGVQSAVALYPERWQSVDQQEGTQMAERVGEAVAWTAEAQGDRVVVARHRDGHRVVFAFSADARNELIVRSVEWVAAGDHDQDFLDAAASARAAARTKGWLY